MSTGPAAYTPYELLRALIRRVGWPDSSQEQAALSSVDQMEALAIFGNLAQMMACTHPADAIVHYSRSYGPQRRYGWVGSDAAAVCTLCGRINP